MLGPDNLTPADCVNFDIGQRSSEETIDYVELGYHVQMLSVVLMNIPQYVELDRKEVRDELTSTHLSPSKRAEAETSLLKVVKGLLDELCGKICESFPFLSVVFVWLTMNSKLTRVPWISTSHAQRRKCKHWLCASIINARAW